MVASLGSQQSRGISPVLTTRTVGSGDGLSERRAEHAAVHGPIHGTACEETGTRRYSTIRRAASKGIQGHRFLGRRAVARKSASPVLGRRVGANGLSSIRLHGSHATKPPSRRQARRTTRRHHHVCNRGQRLPSGSRPAKPGWHGPRAVDAPRGCMSAMSCRLLGEGLAQTKREKSGRERVKILPASIFGRVCFCSCLFCQFQDLRRARAGPELTRPRGRCHPARFASPCSIPCSPARSPGAQAADAAQLSHSPAGLTTPLFMTDVTSTSQVFRAVLELDTWSVRLSFGGILRPFFRLLFLFFFRAFHMVPECPEAAESPCQDVDLRRYGTQPRLTALNREKRRYPTHRVKMVKMGLSDDNSALPPKQTRLT